MRSINIRLSLGFLRIDLTGAGVGANGYKAAEVFFQKPCGLGWQIYSCFFPVVHVCKGRDVNVHIYIFIHLFQTMKDAHMQIFSYIYII